MVRSSLVQTVTNIKRQIF